MLFRASVLLLPVVVLGGCVSHTVRSVDMTPPRQADEAVPEELLFDVGVAVFDANVPEDYDEQIESNVAPEVRRAEANYLAYFLKNLLQTTGNWGAVRVVPRPTHAVDVNVEGTILHSDGESLELEVEVSDATGEQWFKKRYEGLASKYAYDESIPRNIDPFQAVYTAIADDMLAYREQLTAQYVARVRTIAEMKFAREFAPDAFGEHVAETGRGEFELTRLPATSDPMLVRVRRVREREYLFIDTLDEYFSDFQTTMFAPYHDWRRATYDEAIAYKELRAQARSRMVAGTAAIIGGIAAQTSDNGAVAASGTVGIIGGALTLKSGISKRAEAQIHSEVLQELGVSAEAEITPHTMELENQTVQLSGTVDAQYEELKRVLRRIYYKELGLGSPDVVEPEITDDATEGLKDTLEPDS